MLSMGKHFRLKGPGYRILKVFGTSHGSGFLFICVGFKRCVNLPARGFGNKPF